MSRDSNRVTLTLSTGRFRFNARLERDVAPATCEAFIRHLPIESQIIHARWSGEAIWMPLGDLNFGVGPENSTSYPAPGDVLLYPGGISEAEILIPYGGTSFASIVGQLAGNHFLTIVSGHKYLANLGRITLWQGAQDLVIDWTGDQPY